MMRVFALRGRVIAKVARGKALSRPRAHATSATAKPISQPTMPSVLELRRLAVISALPMVGFGFIDNLIMIQAGDLIDQSIGVHFGWATLTCAAFGQIISDFSGTVFGGSIEAFFSKLGLPQPNLSVAQRQLPKVKAVVTASAATGVVVGCLLGALSLLFMDLEAAERLKKQQELDTIFRTVLAEGHKVIGAERVSLFVVDQEKKELWTKVHMGTDEIIRVPMNDSSIVGFVAWTAKPVHVTDAYKDPRFNKSIDVETGFRTRNILCWPVVTKEGVQAVVQFINKVDTSKSTASEFNQRDEDLAAMMCSHIAIFLKEVEG